jgi:ribonuclease HII
MITAGMDEVGRGSWAGPLYVGAVVLGGPIAGLRDSKLLSAAKRQQLDGLIRAQALAFAIGMVTHREIDDLGLTAASSLAYERALAGIKLAYDEVIVDGSYMYLKDNAKARVLVDADQLEPAVSAASIIAKVARDAYMCEQANAYKDYGFERHVGYGTALHAAALKRLGVCDIHRRSFAPVRKIMLGLS